MSNIHWVNWLQQFWWSAGATPYLNGLKAEKRGSWSQKVSMSINMNQQGTENGEVSLGYVELRGLFEHLQE